MMKNSLRTNLLILGAGTLLAIGIAAAICTYMQNLIWQDQLAVALVWLTASVITTLICLYILGCLGRSQKDN